MKWFELADGKEKIQYMFNGEFELDDVIIDKILCYDYTMDLTLYTFTIPQNFPKAWLKQPFNAIEINLEFFNLMELNLHAQDLHHKNGSVRLSFSENRVEFNFINNENVLLSSCSDIIRIAEINPIKISHS